jgi:hypothetical protein
VAHVAGDDLGLPSWSRSKKRTFAVTGIRASPGGLRVVRLSRSPPSPSGQGSGSGSVTRRARLEVADELRGVHLPERALLVRGDAGAHQAALRHLLDPQPPHAARDVLGLRRDVALRAVLAHRVDEGRVGQRVRLAVESEDRGRRGAGACGGPPGRSAVVAAKGRGDQDVEECASDHPVSL